MPDLSADADQRPQITNVQITHDNADILTVKFLSLLYSRLGYVIKLLEQKNG